MPTGIAQSSALSKAAAVAAICATAVVAVASLDIRGPLIGGLSLHGVAMRFEERELKPYAEPVGVAQLTVGSVYFLVNFVDEAMTIPAMQTVVFVGRVDDGRLKFQDVESHRQGVTEDTPDLDFPVQVFVCDEQDASNVFEFEKALDVLMSCSLRRRKDGHA